jgi:hypothetical protein
MQSKRDKISKELLQYQELQSLEARDSNAKQETKTTNETARDSNSK